MSKANNEEHPGLGKGLDRLQGKVAIVTGANSGIGRATARLFAREGAKVVCCDIQETIHPRIDKLIERDGGEALFATIDVTIQADCDRMIATALERFGDLHILFNNAGGGIRKMIHEHTDDEWNFVVNLNLNSIFRGARAAIPHFLKMGRGNIVSTASTFGLLASEKYPAYCATKAAIINLTRQMALDYGPKGIRVNCVCPGAIDTPMLRWAASLDPNPEKVIETCDRMHPVGRIGRAEEVANSIAFLASSWASFITGAALLVDGGMLVPAGGMGFQ